MSARLMLAAPASGGGKTTLTLALLGALARRGLRAASFKCGPDYIDPLFHREVLDVAGGNLDGYFMPPPIVRGLMADAMPDADIAVIEGVMGYYDGIGMTAEASSWALARTTDTPAVLAVTPRGASLSLAALVRGFTAFRPDHGLAGIILNRCSKHSHDSLKPMLERETGLPVLGYFPEIPEATLASRHLGLATPDTVDSLREKIQVLAARFAEGVDMDFLLALARSAPPVADRLPVVTPTVDRPVRLAVARDKAFCFYYRENLELLQALGAELTFFSPLTDASLPEGAAGLYLGGGYPELFAGALARNRALRADIRDRVAAGLPTLAECGGFMYLQEEIVDADGTPHPAVGALPGRCANSGRLGRFGYVEVTARTDTLLCNAGERIRAHEFHYWDSDRSGGDCTAVKPDGRSWDCVTATRTLFAGFPHLSFWSNPTFARNFVAAAAGVR